MISLNVMQDQFSSGLLRNFHRKGLPSPKSATPPGRGHIHSLITGTSLHDSSASSKASSLCFSDSSEQAMFKLADSFAKQFLGDVKRIIKLTIIIILLWFHKLDESGATSMPRRDLLRGWGALRFPTPGEVDSPHP
jgi:hypothetical protein